MTAITPDSLRTCAAKAADTGAKAAATITAAADALQEAEDLAELLLVELFHLRQAVRAHLPPPAAAAVIASATEIARRGEVHT